MARDFQKTILTGRLGKDPHVHTFDDGKKIANFSLCSSNGYMKDNKWVDKPDWHNIVLSGERAITTLEKFCEKGTSVLVSGQIVYEKYEKDGVEKEVTKIKCFEINVLGGFKPKDEGESVEQGQDLDVPDEKEDLPF